MIAPLALAFALASPPDRWFGPDKLKHFLVAAFTQSVAYGALQAARVRHDRAIVGATAVTAAVSIGKEMHDRRTTGEFSVRDLVWDAAGAGAATLLIDRAVRSRPRDAVPPPSPVARELQRVAWTHQLASDGRPLTVRP